MGGFLIYSIGVNQNLFKAAFALFTTFSAGTSSKLNSLNGSRIFSICFLLKVR